MGIMNGEIGFKEVVEKIMPHQRALVSAPYRNAALVGGQGNGKSVALCIAAILHAASEKNGFSLVGRLNQPALINSTMRTFLELVEPSWGEWKPTEKRMVWGNGHETVFWHLDTSDPRVSGHIKSMNLSGAFIDEASEISEEIYFLIDGRVRRKGAIRHAVRLTSNPAGQDWMWRHFFDPNRKDILKKLNLGITATTFDNVHLDKATVEHWVATYPKDWADRYLNGSFADFSDLVYKEFSDRTHVWDSNSSWEIFGNNTMPPANWPTIVGIDIGSDTDHDPWGIVLIAVAPDGSLYQFDEVYGRDLLIATIADEFWQKMGKYRGSANMAYDYSNRQCALELAEHAIYGQPAIKEVQPGLFKTAQYMHIDSRLVHPFMGTQGAPRFYVASHCTNTIRELTGYKYAKDRSGNPTGEPAHAHSHLPDAIRYAIHTFRPLPERMAEPAQWQNPKLDEMSRLYWRDVDKHKRANEGIPDEKRFTRPKSLRFQRASSTVTRRPNLHA